MDNNPFDQFDATASASPAQASANPFDQFDAAHAPPAATQGTITATPDRDQLGQMYWQATAQGDQATAKRAFDLLRSNGYTLPGPDEQGLDAIHAGYKPESIGAIPDFAVAATHHLASIPVGLAQLGTNLAAKAGDLMDGRPQQSMAGLISGQAPQRTGVAGVLDNAANAVNQYATDRENEYQHVVPTNLASIAGAAVGEVAPWLYGVGELRAAGMLPTAANLAGKIGLGTLEGGAMAAAHPVSNATDAGDYLGKEALQTGVGALTGGALPIAAAAPGAAVRGIAGPVDSITQALAKRASDLGIDLTAPQISNSKILRYINSASGNLPFSGAGNFATRQQQQFNQAVGKTIGLNDATAITPDVFHKAVQQAGDTFNGLWSRNNLQITPNVIGDMQGALRSVSQDTGPDSPITKVLTGVANRVVNEAKNSAIPGQTFQSIDTSLGRIIRNGGPESYYAGQLQDALRDGMQQSMSPTDAAALADARGVWQNIKTLTPLVAKGSATGDISPSQLMGAVTSSGVGKHSMATGGRGDLGDLAMIGQRFLKDTTHDSGTAMRSQIYQKMGDLTPSALLTGAATGTAATAGVLPAAAGLGGTLAANRMLSAGLRSRGLYNALGQQVSSQPSPALNNLGLAATRYALLPQATPQVPANQQ